MHRIGDAVNPAFRTTVGLPCYQTVPAAAARLVYVVEGDQVAFGQRRVQRISFDVIGGKHTAYAHMAGDDGIGDAGQATVIEMDVGSAHLARHRLQ